MAFLCTAFNSNLKDMADPYSSVHAVSSSLQPKSEHTVLRKQQNSDNTALRELTPKSAHKLTSVFAEA